MAARKSRMKWPAVAHVAAALRKVNEYDCDAEEGIDVRLQVYPDSEWALRYGYSDYDQDHRGYWGASSVPGSRRRFHALTLAKYLIEQAKDAEADQYFADHVGLEGQRRDR